MRIQHNILAMNAYRNYNANTSALAKNLEKLSSGYRINRAGDDAAGLAISEKMRAQITGLNAAQKNVKDGISLVKTAEGATQEIQDMLNRMKYLATQSANGTYQDEVDRDNIQKEVDALRTEINRIADSSNFNGINLLDGKLGLNTKAFTIDSAAAVAAKDGALSISDYVAKEVDGSPKFHKEGAAVAAATPAATIDLGDISLEIANGSTGSITFTIAGNDYTVSYANTSGSTMTKSATDIATDLATELNKKVNSTNGTTTSPNAFQVGNAAFTAAGAAGKVTLTYAGTKTDGTTYKAETTFSGNAAAAKDINDNLGFDVVVKTVANATRTGDVIHKATNVDEAKAEVVASKAGIDITLDSKFVTQGGTLKIDGQTFVFQTDATTAPTGGTVINVSAATTDADRIHMAADLLSKQTVTGQDSRTWSIGVNGDGTTIHIDQTVASDPGKELDTYDKVVSKIEVKGPATAAKNAGTSVKISQANVQEGDTLNIGDKTFIFSDKKTGTEGNTTYVAIKGDAAANLKSAIGSSAEIDSNDTTKVIVRAANGEAAPSILGKGLMLQIGDTAEDFNQLGVKIGDMHTTAMNSKTGMSIEDIKVSSQQDASDAVEVIKDAINYVSSIRGDLGATQNRLEHTANNLSVMAENIQDAESTIRDTDVAEEMMAYTKNNILVQAAQAMLAQANAVPQGVLQLLQ